MKVAQLRELDVANGQGIRVTLFVSGCTHNCYNCFNKDYQNFNYGEPLNNKHVETIKKNLSKDQISGFSVLGGEPLQNRQGLIDLFDYLQVQNKYHKDIWVWSGYTYEQILTLHDGKTFLEKIDVLVDGLYVESLRDLSLKFRGSSNQRIIDVQASLEVGYVVLWEEKQ